MDLKEYFERAKGRGVLSTADSEGRVDSAVYARPHVMQDGTLAFVMADRLSHHNLQSNPRASYLFMEDGPGWKGRRFFLTVEREEQDPEVIGKYRRRKYAPDQEEEMKPLSLVFFRIDKELPLVGPGPA